MSGPRSQRTAVPALRVVLALCVTALALTAQEDRRVRRVREDLEARRRKLAEQVSLEERLLELRIRHDLGLPVHAGGYFELGSDERDLVETGGRDSQAREEAEARRLSERVGMLQSQVDEARAVVRTRAARRADGETIDPSGAPLWGSVDPVAAAPSVEVALAGADGREPTGGRPAGLAPAGQEPAGQEPVSPGGPAQGATTVGLTPFLLIKGSLDHSAAGRVMLRAGAARLRAARALEAAADPERAAEVRARAVAILEDARRELSGIEKPQLIDLFHLARCEEQLGNVQRADSLFTQIMARDYFEDADGKKNFGRWGRAAQAAKSVLAWATDTGAWRPTVDIGSIRWRSR